MKRIINLLPVFLFLMKTGFAQNISVKGVVMEEKLDGNLVPLEFANVYWQQSSKSTTTDSTGYFFIQHGNADGEKLIFQYLGYDPDTVTVSPGQYLSVVFKEEASVLGEVVVTHRKRTTEVSFLDPLQMQNISSEELFKAACCNLSESFETNATVDVSFTDAITGAKEIQMLGLSGKYSLISQEQMPGIRGLAIPFGLLYTPGPWIESIQISKGVGSVAQGYESMTGQINVELKKPISEEKLHINGFFNEANRYEMNLFGRLPVSKKFKTALLAHYSNYPSQHDRNGDGFLDMPTGNLMILSNRWDYRNTNSGIEGQLNLQVVRDDKKGGNGLHDVDFHFPFHVQLYNERISAVAKVGYVFPGKRYKSIGSQWGYTRHAQDAEVGSHQYNALQQSLYGNWLYQSILSDTRHQYVTGFSFRYDDYEQLFDNHNYDFKEIVPGAFFEYTYKPTELITFVAGVRADNHNIYGWLINPRAHLRYALNDNNVFRISAGRGMRTPLPIVENFGSLASSRQWKIGDDVNSDYPHNGLEMEKAWNFGASFTREFTIDFRSGVLSVDFYHTLFTDRAIADMDFSPQEFSVYNLDGKSFANTFQTEFQYELLKRLDVKVAYKWQDSKITYKGKGLREQVFTPNSRFFLNASYLSSVATYKGHWRVSATAHYTGKQRIPDTDTNPAEYQLPDHSPGYWLMNGQLTRVFKKNFEIYAGAENIFDFKQSPAILSADHPESPYFDSSLIWGPIFGREWYVGFRYSIK